MNHDVAEIHVLSAGCELRASSQTADRQRDPVLETVDLQVRCVRVQLGHSGREDDGEVEQRLRRDGPHLDVKCKENGKFQCGYDKLGVKRLF